MGKFISLLERDGRKISKNETYTFKQLKEAIIRLNMHYFDHWWHGVSRVDTLEIIMDTMDDLIDMDKEGKHKLFESKDSDDN